MLPASTTRLDPHTGYGGLDLHRREFDLSRACSEYYYGKNIYKAVAFYIQPKLRRLLGDEVKIRCTSLFIDQEFDEDSAEKS